MQYAATVSNGVLLGGVQVFIPVTQTRCDSCEAEATFIAHAWHVHLTIRVEERSIQSQRQERCGICRVEDDASEVELAFLNRITLLYTTERQLVTTLQIES